MDLSNKEILCLTWNLIQSWVSSYWVYATLWGYLTVFPLILSKFSEIGSVLYQELFKLFAFIKSKGKMGKLCVPLEWFVHST